MARAARTTAALLLSIAVLVAATGWLYVLRPYDSLPGPRLGDALPLDELSHRGSAALVLYVAVWGAAAVLLALLARRAGAERLTAGRVDVPPHRDLDPGRAADSGARGVPGRGLRAGGGDPRDPRGSRGSHHRPVAHHDASAFARRPELPRRRRRHPRRGQRGLSRASPLPHRRARRGARARPVESARRAARRRARRRGTQSRTGQSPCVGDRRRPAHPAALPERRAAVPRRSDRHRCGRRRSAGAPVRLRPPRRPRLEAANRPPRRRGRSGRARVRPRDAVGEPFDG